MKENRKKYLFIILGILSTIFLIKATLGNGDFKCFIEAANLFRNGDSPYNEWIFVSEGNYCLYFYSPLWLVFLTPFTFLPDFIPNLIWLLLSAFLLVRIWHLLKSYIDDVKLTQKQYLILLGLSLLMTFRFILYNFGTGVVKEDPEKQVRF